jgi:hypothetical protein
MKTTGPTATSFPEFFDQAPRIRLFDPLAEFLGAAEGGIIEYGYADAVRLAGHSCPTVAGAWLMTRRALAHLYAEALPERGAILVEFRDDRQAGVTGVIANVVSLITGATGDTGFKGIAGRFDRRDLLFFNVALTATMRFTRLDNSAACTVDYQAQRVPAAPEIAPLMQKAINGSATEAECRQFGRLWQERVRRILIEYADDPELVVLDG